MAWRTGPNAPLGLANVNPTIPDAVALVPVGTIATFLEDTLGPVEAIYLPGVAATVAGDMVVYDLMPGAVIIARATVAIGANSGRSVAFALGPTVAGQFGWFQISGAVIATVTGSGSTNSALYATATAGGISSTTTAGSQIIGARSVSAVGTPAAGKLYATINRPHLQPQIT